MSDVLELLELRQGDMLNDDFAPMLGVRTTTLWRWRNGKSEIDAASKEKLIDYFSGQNDAEMVGALLAYKSGYSMPTHKLIELGQVFMKHATQDTALVLA